VFPLKPSASMQEEADEHKLALLLLPTTFHNTHLLAWHVILPSSRAAEMSW